jgi:tRNA A22 N-methylase
MHNTSTTATERTEIAMIAVVERGVHFCTTVMDITTKLEVIVGTPLVEQKNESFKQSYKQKRRENQQRNANSREQLFYL